MSWLGWLVPLVVFVAVFAILRRRTLVPGRERRLDASLALMMVASVLATTTTVAGAEPWRTLAFVLFLFAIGRLLYVFVRSTRA